MAAVTMAGGVRRDRRSFEGGPVAEAVPKVREVRHYVRDLVGAGHPCLFAVVQCVSELVTNALKHTRSGSTHPAYGWFVLHLEWDATCVRLGIEDTGPPDRRPYVLDAAATAESGRGLRIVADLADDWLVVPGPSRVGNIVTVWIEAEVRRPGSALRGQQRRDFEMTVVAFAALTLLVVVAGGMTRYAIALRRAAEGISDKAEHAAFWCAVRTALNAHWAASLLRGIHRVVGDLAGEGTAGRGGAGDL